MKGLGVFALAALVAYTNGCRLSQVQVVTNLDEAKMEGSWYEVRFYPSSRYNSASYTNSAIDIRRDSAGLRIKEYMQRPERSTCRMFNEDSRRRTAPGKYEFYRADLRRRAYSYIVSVDYDKFFTEFICLESSGDTCLLPEVIMWYRVPVLNDKSVCPYPQKIEDFLRRGNVCVDVKNFLRIRHYGAACVAPTKPDPYLWKRSTPTNIYGYNYFNYNNMGYMGYPYYGQQDPELLRLRKEKEIAEKEMLIVEKEVMELEKEKLRLSRSGAGGVPK